MDNYLEYVNKYANTHHISVKEAETHAMVKEVKKYYLGKDSEYATI